MNALPIAYALYGEVNKCKFVVSEEFASILDGVSYVHPVVWPIPYSSIPRAVQRLEGKHEIICQAYTHPDDRRLTDSYQKEGWRLAGKEWLPRFGTLPLVFDRRDAMREASLDLKCALLTEGYHVKKKTILVAGKSVSSPFKWNLHDVVSKHFKDYNVTDLSKVHAQRVYDFLLPIERAAVLVTVDTMFLHLARATDTKVVSIINEGWFGSVPPRNSSAVLRYSEATPESVIAAIERSL